MKTRKSPREKSQPDIAPAPAGTTETGPHTLTVLEQFLERHGVWIAILLVAIGTARIVSTYWEFSFTSDEPAHVGAGMEWVAKHVYKYEPQHPPLTRGMAALLPWLAGAHPWGEANMSQEGLHVLWGNGNPDTMLALARAGMLPFFWIMCWAVYAITKWTAGARTPAVFALLLVTNIPSVLAHAGLATTDIGLTATFLLATYALWRWVAEPTWNRAALAGAALGGTVIAKFSTLAFLPATAGAGLALWWFLDDSQEGAWRAKARRLVPQGLVAGAVAAVIVWGIYFFSFGKSGMFSFSVPAPELFDGLIQVQDHNKTGHRAFLLGEIRDTGWYYFYVVALAVKMPLAILGLGIAGLVMLMRKQHRTQGSLLAPSVALGIMVYASFFSRIQIGLRHILPVTVALAIGGGCALYWMLPWLSRKNWGVVATIGTLVLSAAPSILAHPDYIPYFNPLAGSRPDRVLSDSDLDWGQDVKRVAKRLKQLGATTVVYNQLFPGRLDELYGFPSTYGPLRADGPIPGWNVVGPTPLRIGLFGTAMIEYPKGYQFWPDKVAPTEMVGTHRLYYAQPR